MKWKKKLFFLNFLPLETQEKSVWYCSLPFLSIVPHHLQIIGSIVVATVLVIATAVGVVFALRKSPPSPSPPSPAPPSPPTGMFTSRQNPTRYRTMC